MKAKSISKEPQVEGLSWDLAELYWLPDQEWNIGANLVYYRDGNDHTTWHSDDTQGEALILCIVVELHAFAWPILVKPKTNGGFQDGYEEIIIFVGQGDAYEMDGKWKLWLLKKNAVSVWLITSFWTDRANANELWALSSSKARQHKRQEISNYFLA